MCVTNTITLSATHLAAFTASAEAVAPIQDLYDRYTSGALSFNELFALTDILEGLGVLDDYSGEVNLKDVLAQALGSMPEKTS